MAKKQTDKERIKNGQGTIRYNNALHTFTEQILNVLDMEYTLFDLFGTRLLGEMVLRLMKRYQVQVKRI